MYPFSSGPTSTVPGPEGHGAQPQLRQAPRASREALAGAKGPGLCSRRTQNAELDGAVPAPRLRSQPSGWNKSKWRQSGNCVKHLT